MRQDGLARQYGMMPGQRYPGGNPFFNESTGQFAPGYTKPTQPAVKSAQDLISKGYYGYTGWGNTEAVADYNATQGIGKGGPTQTSNLMSRPEVKPGRPIIPVRPTIGGQRPGLNQAMQVNQQNPLSTAQRYGITPDILRILLSLVR